MLFYGKAPLPSHGRLAKVLVALSMLASGLALLPEHPEPTGRPTDPVAALVPARDIRGGQNGTLVEEFLSTEGLSNLTDAQVLTTLGLARLPVKEVTSSWSASVPLLGREGHALVSIGGGRLLVWGGRAGDVWDAGVYLIRTSDGGVEGPLAVNGTPPSPRADMAFAFDGSQNALYVLGGVKGGVYLGGLYRLWTTNWTWESLATTGTSPGNVAGGSMIVRAGRDELWYFGGLTDLGYVDGSSMYVLNLNTLIWQQHALTGTPPGHRSHFMMVYSIPQDAIFIFGGDDGSPVGTTFAVDPKVDNSESVAAGGAPSARSRVAYALDPTTGKVYVYGGLTTAVEQSLYVFDTGSRTWSFVAAFGMPGCQLMRGAWDSQLYLWGSHVSREAPLYRYAPGSGAWTPVTNRPPATRSGAAWAQRTGYHTLFLFGGGDGAPTADMYVLNMDTGAWQGATLAAFPPPRSGARLVYDGNHDRFYLFGGRAGNGTLLGDLWSYTVTGGWVQNTTSGTAPSPRTNATCAYHAATHRMVVLGGLTGSGPVMDLHLLDLASKAWTAPALSGDLPSARYGMAGAVDPVRNCLYLFGGRNGSAYSNETFVLYLSNNTFNRLAPLPAPGRADAGLVFRTGASSAMFLFGGHGERAFTDLWSLVPPAGIWTEAPRTGVAPTPLWSPVMQLDPSDARRLDVFGWPMGSPYAAMEYDIDGSCWSAKSVPAAAVSLAAASYSHKTGKYYVFGGWVGEGCLSDGLMTFDPLTGTRVSVPVTGAARPGPRYGHGLAVDPLNGDLVLAGGLDRDDHLATSWWRFSSGVWTAHPGGPAVANASWVVDAGSRAVYAVGGEDGAGLSNRIYKLDLATGQWINWTMIGLDARTHPAAAYSPSEEAIYLWGGRTESGPTPILMRLSLTSNVATTVSLTGQIPTGSVGAVMGYRSEENRLYLFTPNEGLYTINLDTKTASRVADPFGLPSLAWGAGGLGMDQFSVLGGGGPSPVDRWTVFGANLTFVPSAQVVSVTLEAGGDVGRARINLTADIPAGTSVDLSISHDGGANWTDAAPGSVVTFEGPGSQIQWSIALRSTSPYQTPVLEKVTVDYWLNEPPNLAWTGEDGFALDALSPESGDPATAFEFRILYTDPEGHPPATGFPQAVVYASDAGTTEVAGSPFTLAYVSGDNLTGAIYAWRGPVPLGNHTYVVRAADSHLAYAADTPRLPGPSVEDVKPPWWPTGVGLRAVAGDGWINLSWNPAEDNETGEPDYLVYRRVAAETSWILRTETVLRWYYDSDVANGVTYQYRVQARDKAGNLETNDVIVSATPSPPDVTPPTWQGNPGLTYAVAGDGWVDLGWSSASDPSPPVTYQLYRRLDGETYGAPLAAGLTSTTYRDENVTNGVTYWYRVRARDAQGNEDNNTVELSAVPGPPPDLVAPTWPGGTGIQSVELDGTDVVITWAVAVDDSGGPVTYVVYRGVDGGRLSIVAEGLNGTEWTDEGPPGGHTYTYRVRARDAQGNEDNNTNDLWIEVPAIPVVQPPSNVRVENVTHESATVLWDATPAGTYRVYLRESGQTGWTRVVELTGVGCTELSGLNASTSYDVAVATVKGTEEGLSAAVPFTTTAVPQATILSVNIEVEGGLATFTLIYRDTSGAPPARVVVVVDGSESAMALISGNISSGATYQISLPVSAGTHTYRFSVTDARGRAVTPAAGVTAEGTFEGGKGAKEGGVPVWVWIAAGAAVLAVAGIAVGLLLLRSRSHRAAVAEAVPAEGDGVGAAGEAESAGDQIEEPSEGDDDLIIGGTEALAQDLSHEPGIEVFKTNIPLRCNVCLGTIKRGLPVVKCRCGKHFHKMCAIRVGVCPLCGTDLSPAAGMEVKEAADAPVGGGVLEPGIEVFTASEPLRCHVCMGMIKKGLPVVKCACGKNLHQSCAARVGACPFCGRSLAAAAAMTPEPQEGAAGAPPAETAFAAVPEEPGGVKVFHATAPIPCGVCGGTIKVGLTVVQCPCGTACHKACAERAMECPTCGRRFGI